MTSLPRLKSKILVQALVRRAEVAGASAYVLRKGAEEAGMIFLKVNRLDGTIEVLSPSQALTPDGAFARVWTRPLGERTTEEESAAYFDRQMKFDPDLWIVEIEDRQGRNFVDDEA